jgi:hypothetical protein
MANQKLTKTVSGVLGDPNVWKINFELNGLIVTCRGFGEVSAEYENANRSFSLLNSALKRSKSKSYPSNVINGMKGIISILKPQTGIRVTITPSLKEENRISGSQPHLYLHLQVVGNQILKR